MLLRTFQIFFISFILSACSAAPQNPALEDGLTLQSTESIMQDIENKHPISYLVLASKFWQQGEFEQAGVWYYIGQIRYTTFLKTQQGTALDSDVAMLASTQEITGRLVNQYGKQDVEKWAGWIEQAIDWHQHHPDGFTDKQVHAAEFDEVTEGFRIFQQYLLDNQKSLEAESDMSPPAGEENKNPA